MDYYKTVLATLQKWGLPESHSLAYGSTLLISLAPFLLLFLVRVENTPSHKNYLRVALSFASGGLLGDAFLHLIPHSMGHGSHDHGHEHGHDHGHADHHHDHAHEHGHDHAHAHDHHDHGHSHAAEEDHGHSHLEQTYVGLYIVSGIVLFFLIEKLLHFLKGGHSHSHSHSPAKKSKSKPKVKKAKVSDSEDSDSEELIKKGKNGNQVSQTRMVSGFLNLIADFLHNFTDGLAIGATFAAGKSMGTITAFTIFMHEIPHEIGDYAILIQAGYKRSSAIALQLVTAIGALIGTYVGLHYGNMEHAQQFILPVTAGGFIYIATVSVIPELLEKTSSFLQTLVELAAMFAGLAMMFWIALNE